MVETQTLTKSSKFTLPPTWFQSFQDEKTLRTWLSIFLGWENLCTWFSIFWRWTPPREAFQPFTFCTFAKTLREKKLSWENVKQDSYVYGTFVLSYADDFVGLILLRVRTNMFATNRFAWQWSFKARGIMSKVGKGGRAWLAEIHHL